MAVRLNLTTQLDQGNVLPEETGKIRSAECALFFSIKEIEGLRYSFS